MNISTSQVEKSGLPEGFVYIDEWIEDCIIDTKYAGTDNFMGAPAAGYERPLAVMTKQAAEACQKAASALRRQGWLLKFYDAYRPCRAVEHFAAWSRDSLDCRRKTVHYPRVEKDQLFQRGYISEKSGHSRGSTVDLTLVNSETYQEADMGTIFDFMDERSHHGAAGLTALQEENRSRLRKAMEDAGFCFYANEWWHYTLKEEPYPDTYFDFPIR